jgi:hypothetical protein
MLFSYILNSYLKWLKINSSIFQWFSEEYQIMRNFLDLEASMKRATREFLKHRPRATFISVKSITIEGTSPNDCYKNACLMADANEADLLVTGGWIVGDFFADRGTAIIPHYWVYNEKTRENFDPTPQIPIHKQNYDYVNDGDIMGFGNPRAILPVPLRLLPNGTFQARTGVDQYLDLQKIDVAELYRLQDA